MFCHTPPLKATSWMPSRLRNSRHRSSVRSASPLWKRAAIFPSGTSPRQSDKIERITGQGSMVSPVIAKV